MSSFELKLPPPLLALGCAILMWILAKLAGGSGQTGVQPLSLLSGFALAVAITGLGIGFIAVQQFRKAQTTLSPLKPESSSALVDTGIFSKSRNPMYLGVLLILTGWAIYLGQPITLAGLVIFVLYITRFQIVPEERVLMKTFGRDFTDYKGRVRRWI